MTLTHSIRLSLILTSLIGMSFYTPGVLALSTLSTDYAGTTTATDFLLQQNNAEKMRLTGTGVRISSVGGYLDYRPNGTACTNGQTLSWDNTNLRWICASAGGGGWSLLGNAGTNASTNFLGTTDNVDVVFKRNNIESFRLQVLAGSTGSIVTTADAKINGLTVGRGNGAISSNTAVGSGALISNTAGFNNTANGSAALYLNTLGYDNTANGYYALTSNTTGYGNTANGSNTLRFNTTGVSNTANGYSALISNTDGSSNTANGVSSLMNNTTGTGNTANGVNSLMNNTTGYGNTANGIFSLVRNTTGVSNTANGYQAGYHVTLSLTGSNNTFLGANTTYTNGAITNATAIGANVSLTQSNTLILGSGANVGIGTNTPSNLLTVNGTGSFAGIRISSGAQNGFILTSDASGNARWAAPAGGGWGLTGNAGTNASTNFLGTTDNVDVVFKRNNIEAFRLTTASGTIQTALDMRVNGITIGRGKGNEGSNTAVGSDALFSHSGGWNNSAFGIQALYNTVGGANNHAFGFQALYNNTSGGSNVAVGCRSMYSNLSGQQNVAVGCESLYANLGFFNVGLGYQSLSNLVSGNSNIGLGRYSGSGLTTGSNNIAIGDNTSFVSNTGSNQLNIGNWIYGNGGNIGIGRSTPGYKLDVAGTGSFYGLRISSGATNNYVLTSDATGNARWAASAGGGWGLTGNAGTNPATNFLGTTDNVDVVFKRNNIESLRMTNSGVILSGGVLIGIAQQYTDPAYDTTTPNLRFGKDALTATGNGSYNIAFGHSALESLTDGSYNIAIGSQALNNNLTSSENIAIGTHTLLRHTGSWGVGANIAIGNGTLSDSTTGISNVAIGVNTLTKANVSSQNVALGRGNLETAVTGDDNISVGSEALQYAGTASSNTALGRASMRYLVTPSGNIGIGSSALSPTWTTAAYAATMTPTSSTAVSLSAPMPGVSAGQYVYFTYSASSIPGIDSTIYQQTRMLRVLTSTTAEIVISGAGPDQNLTVSGNATATLTNIYRSPTYQPNNVIALGNSAGTSSPGGSGTILIGNGIQAPNATTQNQLNIGNWIYGSGGNIGIGTSTPGSKLDVNGTFKLGTSGTVTTAAGVCTIASTAISTTATAYTCTGVPASTAVAVNCSAAAAFTTPGTTALYCRANGTASSVTCNTTAVNAVATTYKCMWMQ